MTSERSRAAAVGVPDGGDDWALTDELKQLEDELRDLDLEGHALDGHAQGGTDHGGTLAALQQRVAELEQQEEELAVTKETAERKLAEAEQSRREQLSALMEETSKLEKLAQEEAQKKDISIQNSAKELAAIAEKREQELEGLYRQLREMQQENAKVMQNLQSLQQLAANEIPKIEDEKFRMSDDIALSWDNERRDLEKVYQNQKVIQRELFWHLKRGSYIKQQFKDPRNPDDTFEKKGNALDAMRDMKDSRISSEENKLVKEHNLLKDQLANQKDEIKQLKRGFDDIDRRWNAKPEMANNRIVLGRDGLPKLPEGSQDWYNQRVQRLRATLNREERLTKELVNESAELKTVRNGMAEQKQESRRQQDRVLEQTRLEIAKQKKDKYDQAKEEQQQKALHPQRIAREPMPMLTIAAHNQPKARGSGTMNDGKPAAGLPYHK